MSHLRVDLHTHPLVHKYYMKPNLYRLCNDDCSRIHEMIHFAIDQGIEVLSLSDHDGIQASLYGREYVRERKLPIQIVIGSEVSAYEPGHGEVHIGAYGLSHNILVGLPVADTIRLIHEYGGIAILNHPMFCDEYVIHLTLPLVDGVEIYNHGTEVSHAISQRRMAREDYGATEEQVAHIPMPGVGYFKHPLLEEYPNLIRLRGSDNHGDYRILRDIFPFTPGTLDENWLRKNGLI